MSAYNLSFPGINYGRLLRRLNQRGILVFQEDRSILVGTLKTMQHGVSFVIPQAFVAYFEVYILGYILVLVASLCHGPQQTGFFHEKRGLLLRARRQTTKCSTFETGATILVRAHTIVYKKRSQFSTSEKSTVYTP